MQPTEDLNSNNSAQTSEEFWEQLTALSDEDAVREMASLFFEVGEIASFIGMDPDEFASIIEYQPENILTKAYKQGKLKTKVLLRFDARRYALSGSPEATREMLTHLAEQTKSEKDA